MKNRTNKGSLNRPELRLACMIVIFLAIARVILFQDSQNLAEILRPDPPGSHVDWPSEAANADELRIRYGSPFPGRVKYSEGKTLWKSYVARSALERERIGRLLETTGSREQGQFTPGGLMMSIKFVNDGEITRSCGVGHGHVIYEWEEENSKILRTMNWPDWQVRLKERELVREFDEKYESDFPNSYVFESKYP